MKSAYSVRGLFHAVLSRNLERLPPLCPSEPGTPPHASEKLMLSSGSPSSHLPRVPLGKPVLPDRPAFQIVCGPFLHSFCLYCMASLSIRSSGSSLVSGPKLPLSAGVLPVTAVHGDLGPALPRLPQLFRRTSCWPPRPSSASPLTAATSTSPSGFVLGLLVAPASAGSASQAVSDLGGGSVDRQTHSCPWKRGPGLGTAAEPGPRFAG